MPYTHTPTTMFPDNQGAWYSRSELERLIAENRDLRGANKLLHRELKDIRKQVAELVSMMRNDKSDRPVNP